MTGAGTRVRRGGVTGLSFGFRVVFLWACTHEIYVLVLFGVYRWKMHHGADGTCLFYLACTDGRYMLVSFGVYRWNMLVLFGVYRLNTCCI